MSQSHPHNNNISINYRPQIQQLRHKCIKQKLLNGAGDENPMTLLSSEQKRINFIELENILDNAIRNHRPIELYKKKSQINHILLTPNENLSQKSESKFVSIVNNNPTYTQIELSDQQNINNSLVHKIKQHKIISALILLTISIIIGFLSIFIFIK